MDEFAAAFADADRLLVLDIYAASEQPIAGVSGLTLASRIRCAGERPAEFAASFAAAVDAVVQEAQAGDLILTLGAGNVSQLGPQIVERLQARMAAALPG
jgi:UDP-N-acetylmuramate--alanine ligase